MHENRNALILDFRCTLIYVRKVHIYFDICINSCKVSVFAYTFLYKRFKANILFTKQYIHANIFKIKTCKKPLTSFFFFAYKIRIKIPSATLSK